MSETDVSTKDIFVIDDEIIRIFTWLVYSVMCQLLNIFGIFANIVNIICFVRQGFKDPVNISLLGLSISDLGSITTTIIVCIHLTPAFMGSDLTFANMEVCYLIGIIPRFSFVRVSSCFTAMITLERCLCIVAPLQIKVIVTPKRTAVVTVCIFIIMFCSGSPVYSVNRLGMTFSPERNRTILGLIHLENHDQVETMSYVMNNVAIPFCAFAIILTCTTILSIKLRSSQKWRQASSASNHVDRITKRNQKVSKMVLMISTLFIVCFVPDCFIILAVAFAPALSVEGKYLNITILVGGFAYLLECINLSMNIFVYYHMSSKYRENFYNICYCTKQNEKNKPSEDLNI